MSQSESVDVVVISSSSRRVAKRIAQVILRRLDKVENWKRGIVKGATTITRNGESVTVKITGLTEFSVKLDPCQGSGQLKPKRDNIKKLSERLVMDDSVLTSLNQLF